MGWGYVGQGQIWDTGGVIWDKANISKLVAFQQNYAPNGEMSNLFLCHLIKITPFKSKGLTQKECKVGCPKLPHFFSKKGMFLQVTILFFH